MRLSRKENKWEVDVSNVLKGIIIKTMGIHFSPETMIQSGQNFDHSPFSSYSERGDVIVIEEAQQFSPTFPIVIKFWESLVYG